MSHHPRSAIHRAPDALVMGASVIERTPDALTVSFRERTAPWRQRLEGHVRLHLERDDLGDPVDLDADGRHRWYPVAPRARAEVSLTHPRLRFSGPAYHDINDGDLGLEDTFRAWSWCRAATPDGAAAILYDVTPRAGAPRPWGRRFPRRGAPEPIDPPRPVSLPSGLWGMPRATRVDPDGHARLLRPLEDAPFYTRSLLEADLCGQRAVAVHESVDLDRYRRDWVQLLLPFRMRGGRR